MGVGLIILSLPQKLHYIEAMLALRMMMMMMHVVELGSPESSEDQRESQSQLPL